MNRRMMVGCAMLAMLAMLAGCGEAAASSASSEVSAASVSSEASQAIGLAEQAAEQAAAEPELSHEESFYTDRVRPVAREASSLGLTLPELTRLVERAYNDEEKE